MAKVRTHYNLSPEEYEQSRDGHQNRRRAEMVGAALSDVPHARSVLEVGCGTGLLLRRLAERHPGVQFMGTDVDERMIEYASTRHRLPNLEFALCDVTAGLPGRTFDYVFSIDMIHHLHDHRSGFRAIRGALAPGGSWVAVEPNIWNPYIYWQQEHMRRAGFDEDHFRYRRLRHLFVDAGFRLERRRWAFVFPAALKSVPAALARAERLVERVPVVGGSVVCTFRAT